MEEKSMSAEGLTLAEVSELAQKNKVRIEMVITPEGLAVRREITVEPWVEFVPRCPYGLPDQPTKKPEAEV